MQIKTGDWAVLRNGQVTGPIVFDAEMKTYSYYVQHGAGFVTGPWTSEGRYKSSDETLLDIIAVIPCHPLERIRQLEEALRAIERHNDNPAHYDSHINKLCMAAIGDE